MHLHLSVLIPFYFSLAQQVLFFFIECNSQFSAFCVNQDTAIYYLDKLIIRSGRYLHSTHSRRACMTTRMNVDEARGVCNNRSRWRYVGSAYPYGRKAWSFQDRLAFIQCLSWWCVLVSKDVVEDEVRLPRRNLFTVVLKLYLFM